MTRRAAPIEPAILTVDEAATYLNISLNTMYRLSAARALPVVQLSARRIGFRRRDLDAYIDRVTDSRTTA